MADLKQLESLTVYERENSCEEKIIDVPETFAKLPLGFTVDIGGSVTKLAYRSKYDYCDRTTLTGHHQLRLRFFAHGEEDKIIQFLKDNCDIVTSPETDAVVWCQTGVGMQHWADKLDDAFHIRTKIMSELDALICSLSDVSKLLPQLCPVPISEQVIATVLEEIRQFLLAMQQYKAAGIKAFGESRTRGAEVDIKAWAEKLMTADATTMAKELNSQHVQFPCFVVTCGSALSSFILHEDGSHEIGGFATMAGKTFLGLGRILTGAKDFDELMELASKGDNKKVDILTEELKKKGRAEKDFYSFLAEGFTVFALGKLAESQFDGSYSKADIAAGLLRMQCDELANFGLLNARLQRLKSVLYVGSFVESPLVRQVLEKRFLFSSLLLPFKGEHSLTLHILPYPGFLTALGVWYHNFSTVSGQLNQLTQDGV